MPIDEPPDLRVDPSERRGEPARRRAAWPWALALLVLAAGVAGWWWSRPQPPAPPVAGPAPAPVTAASAPASAPQAAAAPAHPVEALPDTSPLAAGDVAGALADLLGSKTVSTFLLTEDFPRRFVATVDSLGRDHSPRLSWPVQPTPGRFQVEQRPDGSSVIATENASRYTPFVLLAATLDVKAAVRLYRRMYPLLQQAYVELGFPKRYFNDRLIEVIDLLLATPEPAEPPRVVLTEVRGPIPPERPWVRYEFADPQLQSLAAGQKILVRMGTVNERRLKAKLAELRQELLQPTASAGGR